MAFGQFITMTGFFAYFSIRQRSCSHCKSMPISSSPSGSGDNQIALWRNDDGGRR